MDQLTARLIQAFLRAEDKGDGDHYSIPQTQQRFSDFLATDDKGWQFYFFRSGMEEEELWDDNAVIKFHHPEEEPRLVYIHTTDDPVFYELTHSGWMTASNILKGG